MPLVHAKAERVQRPVKRVGLRDGRSRWGSCGPDGGLSFSWRLVFAPPEVLDYLVAHEVAHLVHMNHGPRFWAQARALCDGPMEPPQAWLRPTARPCCSTAADVRCYSWPAVAFQRGAAAVSAKFLNIRLNEMLMRSLVPSLEGTWWRSQDGKMTMRPGTACSATRHWR